MRAAIAAGTYVAQDLRDRDGLTRPMLRRVAIRMAVSRQPALRRLGASYLRTDPPTPEELPVLRPRQELTAGPPPALPEESGPAPADAPPTIDVDPTTVAHPV
jgi:hypothetical protein